MQLQISTVLWAAIAADLAGYAASLARWAIKGRGRQLIEVKALDLTCYLAARNRARAKPVTERSPAYLAAGLAANVWTWARTAS